MVDCIIAGAEILVIDRIVGSCVWWPHGVWLAAVCFCSSWLRVIEAPFCDVNFADNAEQLRGNIFPILPSVLEIFVLIYSASIFSCCLQI